MSIVLFHLANNDINNDLINENTNLLMALSSKYLEYVPIGGNIINRNNYKYIDILKNGLRETREETMNIINDRFVKIVDDDDIKITYLCVSINKNIYSHYILYKKSFEITFDNLCVKKCFYIIHFIKDIDIIHSIDNLKDIRKYTIDYIKSVNKEKLYICDINIKNNIDIDNIIEKINNIYIFEKTNNINNKKLYISPYLETIELKWFPLKYIRSDIFLYNTRLFDNSRLYNIIFTKSWDILINYINNNNNNIIDKKWLLNYLEGKDIDNNFIINKYYKQMCRNIFNI